MKLAVEVSDTDTQDLSVSAHSDPETYAMDDNPWRSWPQPHRTKHPERQHHQRCLGLDGVPRDRIVEGAAPVVVGGVEFIRGTALRWNRFGDVRVVYTEPGHAFWLEATREEIEEIGNE